MSTMKPPVLMLTAAAALTLLLTLIMSLIGGREPGSGPPPVRPQTAMAQAAAPVKSGPWAASAPGRVEPNLVKLIKRQAKQPGQSFGEMALAATARSDDGNPPSCCSNLQITPPL